MVRQYAAGQTEIRDAFSLTAIHAVTPPAEFRSLITGIARTHFIADSEMRALTIIGLKSMVASATKRNENDTDHIAPLLKEFGVTAKDLGSDGFRFIKMQILHALDKGSILNGVELEGAEILLEPDEKPIWRFGSVEHETTQTGTRTRYVGGSHGISVRVAKGLSYRVGSFTGRPIKTKYVSHDREQGILVIASRNVYFKSGPKVIKIPIKKILSAEAYWGAIQITREGTRADSETFTVDDPSFATDVITRLHQIPSGSYLSPDDSPLTQLIADYAVGPTHESAPKKTLGPGFLVFCIVVLVFFWLLSSLAH